MLPPLFLPPEDQITMPHDTENQPFDPSACSRAMGSGVFGPLDDSIDFRVNGDSKILWMQEARRRGFSSVADFIRLTMEKEVRGEKHVLSMFTAQLMGNGRSVGQEQDVQS